MQVVFQDPYGSLSPRMSVGDIVTEGLRVHEPALSRADRDRRAAHALEEVGLDAVGTEQRRREAAWIAWCSVDSSINPELVASLQSIDPNITVLLLDPNKTGTVQLGKAFGTLTSGGSTAWPNYSDDHVMWLRWAGCPAGIPPQNKRAQVERLLNKALPAWADYTITNDVALFYLDGFMGSCLDLTPFGA